ncbi:unnamed protein product [Blepharisma stoltei]|uniref:Uncharacterized protein n=1 Tax=Blepharisma stoltei TaxID=1481888 RepID=A0AAU9J951_9CILI|nr:unnamed protein product [Blepharisma stoltei]
MFSAIKLGLIIFVLIKDSNLCIEALTLSFILIGACEAYELIFSCLVVIPPFLFHQNVSQGTIYAGQLIYEL